MTLEGARAALVVALDGLEIAENLLVGQAGETLHAYEYPPGGELAEDLPVAFVIGPPETWVYLPNDQVQIGLDDLSVIVYLGPFSEDPEALERRRARWLPVLRAALQGAQTLGGHGAIASVRVGALRGFYGSDQRGVAWGFEVAVVATVFEAY